MESLSILDFPRLTWQADTTELLDQRYLLNAIYSYLHMRINTLHRHRSVALKHLFLLRFQNTSHESLEVLCFCFCLTNLEDSIEFYLFPGRLKQVPIRSHNLYSRS